MTRDIAQQFAQAVIDLMEREKTGWKQPWIGGGAHISATTKLPYRGINQFVLGMSGRAHQWATYKGWASLGAQVRKGEKATQIVFWKQMKTREDDDDERRMRLMARLYSVFAADQVDNPPKLDPVAPRPPPERNAIVDDVIDRTGIKIIYGGDRAYYHPATDEVHLPKPEQFESVEALQTVTMHELAHATGAPHRLNREFGKRFGDKAYAVEELLAETSAALTCVTLGVTPEPRPESARYLNNWVAALREKPSIIFTVFGAAQRATDFIINGPNRPVASDQPEGQGAEPS